MERALAALGRCAMRHGALDRIELCADGPSVRLEPVPKGAVGICLAEELRDMAAAVAVRAIAALGGTTERRPVLRRRPHTHERPLQIGPVS